MISMSTIAAFVIAAVCTLALPIVLLIVLGVKRKINGLPLLLGAVAFFLSQIVLRIPMLNMLSGQSWYMDFMGYLIPFVLFLSLTAGIFEESARLGGALILKKRRTFKDIISFGLGHGICEAILLIGLTHINNSVFSIAINDTSGAMATAIGNGMLESVRPILMAVNPFHVYLGILERFSAVVFHIFATVLVFKGVIEKKWLYYILAIAAHTVFNFASVIVGHYAGVLSSQVVLLIMAVIAGMYVMKSNIDNDSADM